MEQVEETSQDLHHFPTHAAYLVPVEIKETPQYGQGQKGVFAMEGITEGTKLWVWTHRVLSLHHKDLPAYIERNFGEDREKIKTFLRQGFVLPPSSSSETMAPPTISNEDLRNDNNAKAKNADDYFHSNPTDSGRLTNHSSDPNTGPDGALRDIFPGEELTMDYSFHGNPEWYQNICAKYGVLTEAQVAEASVAIAR